MKRSLMKNDESKPDANTLLLLHGDELKDDSIYDRAVHNVDINISPSGKFDNSYYISNRYMIVELGYISIGDFTIDFWMRQDGKGLGAAMSNNKYPWNAADMFSIHFEANNTIVVYEGSNAIFRVKDSMPPNSWNHIALVRYNNLLRLFINGGLLASIAYSSVIDFNEIRIGKQHWFENTDYSCIDEFRFSNIARWTFDFTPPTKPY